MEIIVTQEDINHGVKGSCGRCPIARAFQRATNNSGATIGWNFAWIEPNVNDRWHLPDKAKGFIWNFDAGFDVQPFTFELPL